MLASFLNWWEIARNCSLIKPSEPLLTHLSGITTSLTIPFPSFIQPNLQNAPKIDSIERWSGSVRLALNDVNICIQPWQHRSRNRYWHPVPDRGNWIDRNGNPTSYAMGSGGGRGGWIGKAHSRAWAFALAGARAVKRNSLTPPPSPPLTGLWMQCSGHQKSYAENVCLCTAFPSASHSFKLGVGETGKLKHQTPQRDTWKWTSGVFSRDCYRSFAGSFRSIGTV